MILAIEAGLGTDDTCDRGRLSRQVIEAGLGTEDTCDRGRLSRQVWAPVDGICRYPHRCLANRWCYLANVGVNIYFMKQHDKLFYRLYRMKFAQMY
jgi:hypothetical protein